MWLQLVATSLFTSHRKKATCNCSPVASPSEKLQLDLKTLVETVETLVVTVWPSAATVQTPIVTVWTLLVTVDTCGNHSNICSNYSNTCIKCLNTYDDSSNIKSKQWMMAFPYKVSVNKVCLSVILHIVTFCSTFPHHCSTPTHYHKIEPHHWDEIIPTAYCIYVSHCGSYHKLICIHIKTWWYWWWYSPGPFRHSYVEEWKLGSMAFWLPLDIEYWKWELHCCPMPQSLNLVGWQEQ